MRATGAASKPTKWLRVLEETGGDALFRGARRVATLASPQSERKQGDVPLLWLSHERHPLHGIDRLYLNSTTTRPERSVDGTAQQRLVQGGMGSPRATTELSEVPSGLSYGSLSLYAAFAAVLLACWARRQRRTSSTESRSLASCGGFKNQHTMVAATP